MFPLNSNDQYIDSNGKRSKLGDAIGSGGGGLPEHTEADAGKVLKVADDGSLEWDEDGGAGVVVLVGTGNPSDSLGENGNMYCTEVSEGIVCDPAYYVNTTTQRLATHSDEMYKTYPDPAIAVHYHQGSYYGPLLIGLSEDSVILTGNPTQFGTVTIDGVTWHISGNNHWTAFTDNPTIPTLYDLGLELNETNKEAIVRAILTASNGHLSETLVVGTAFLKVSGHWQPLVGSYISDIPQ